MDYWVSYVRPGTDLQELSRLGFKVLLPAVRDYVFLEVSEEKRWIVDQAEKYGLLFLRGSKGDLETSTEEEVNRMVFESGGKITKGCKVLVMDGPYKNLEGIIIDEDGDSLVVMADGFSRKYEVKVQRGQVSLLSVRQEGIVELGGG